MPNNKQKNRVNPNVKGYDYSREEVFNGPNEKIISETYWPYGEYPSEVDGQTFLMTIPGSKPVGRNIYQKYSQDGIDPTTRRMVSSDTVYFNPAQSSISINGVQIPTGVALYQEGAKKDFEDAKKKSKPVEQKQQGVTMGEQDIQKQIVALVQAAMQGNQEATQQIEQIMQAAKQGDQQAMQIAQMIQQVIQAMKTPKAKYGTKLDYIKKLKGDCPDGEVKVFLKNGGCLCRKKQEGGEIKEAPKKKMNAVEAFKAACGKKLKK